MSLITLPSPGDLAALPVNQLPAVIAALASLQATAAMQLMQSAPPHPRATPAVDSPALDTKAAARLLGISPTALRRLVASGEVPTMRFGRRLCFRRETLDALRAARERVAGVGR